MLENELNDVLMSRNKQHKCFAMESVKICRFKTFWVRIFARRTLLPFRHFSVHVKMCVSLTFKKYKTFSVLLYQHLWKFEKARNCVEIRL